MGNIQKIEEFMENKIVYHYCSTEKAYNILHGRTIRLSDIIKSNDRLEMSILFPEYFDDLLKIYDELDGCESTFDYNEKIDGDTWREFVTDLKWHVTKLLEEGRISTYVMCFSEKGDLLSQWRGYADDAQGMALGFDFNMLKKYAVNSGLLELKKVIYLTEQERKDLVYESAKEVFHIVNILLQARRDGDIVIKTGSKFGNYIFENICWNILQQVNDTICYKMDGFEEEREWRLYFDNSINKDLSKCEVVRYLGNNEYQNQQAVDFINQRLYFQPTQKDIIPYLRITFEEIEAGERDVIREIIIGPCNSIDESTMKLFLQKQKIENCVFRNSKVKYTRR